ncbi:hypothetical protein PoB_004606100 [Plakobranchus ocellatus]|uniref:Uncharacterized protein n=1 Tax=Plakobranchus ocellatus TaxID=259542 RepID=A0AAV4B834_9GAST|nr:hypothetical protein PoB_004606100 [Plakobranchus ocellatus]
MRRSRQDDSAGKEVRREDKARWRESDIARREAVHERPPVLVASYDSHITQQASSADVLSIDENWKAYCEYCEWRDGLCCTERKVAWEERKGEEVEGSKRRTEG